MIKKFKIKGKATKDAPRFYLQVDPAGFLDLCYDTEEDVGMTLLSITIEGKFIRVGAVHENIFTVDKNGKIKEEK